MWCGDALSAETGTSFGARVFVCNASPTTTTADAARWTRIFSWNRNHLLCSVMVFFRLHRNARGCWSSRSYDEVNRIEEKSIWPKCIGYRVSRLTYERACVCVCMRESLRVSRDNDGTNGRRTLGHSARCMNAKRPTGKQADRKWRWKNNGSGRRLCYGNYVQSTEKSKQMNTTGKKMCWKKRQKRQYEC